MEDKRLDRIENKIDAISEHLSSIDVTLAKQHISLAEHVRRTNLLEKKLEPVERHVALVNASLKLLGVLALLSSVIEAVLMAVK